MESSLHRRWLVYLMSPVFSGEPPLISTVDLGVALQHAGIPKKIVQLNDGNAEGLWEWAQAQGIATVTTVVETIERLLVKQPAAVAAVLRSTGGMLPPDMQLRLAAEVWSLASPEAQAEIASAIRSALTSACVIATAPRERTTLPLTRSQQLTFDKMWRMASAFFAGEGRQGVVQARWIPLLAGPSGLGKTFLARRVADYHGATFHKIPVGQWIPVGARDSEPTLTGIMRLLSENRPAVVLLDEFDKLQGGFGTTWQQSTFAEIFSLLDRDLLLAPLLRRAQIGTDPQVLNRRLRDSMFLVCAGTWQQLWQRGESLGFGLPVSSDNSDQRRLIEADSIPAELLLRCHLPPLRLDYPSAEEAKGLFDAFGITALALRVGRTLAPEKHDWRAGGMRSLENLVAELWLESSAKNTPCP